MTDPSKNELPKNYDKNREPAIFKNWTDKGYFKATPHSGKKPYTIIMPPPNVTSQLHMGHALNNGIQDMLIRFKRMQGYETLWMPGTDHAAIATEVVVVKALAKEGITKESLGREKFLEKMWEWCEQYGGTIVSQLKTLGCSADWDRLRFTMDEVSSKAVMEVFVRLYKSGKIYKGERLVNWCVKCGTSISDAEVEHEDLPGGLYHFKYPVEDGSFITFATTRPETMLGDTAIAINPDDDRYRHLVGKTATVPFVNRPIPIIADSYVDKDYGTGVVKITPAHDPNDFEIGERHNLPRINIMHDDGTINENGAHFAGLSRENARIKIIDDMTALGLYIKKEDLTHAVGTHDRCDTVVEPLLKLQWFVSMEELAKPALEAYTSGKLKFNRDRFGKIYKHWLDNIRDWCISRQLWWGHRIPAWYDGEGNIYVAHTQAQAQAEFEAYAKGNQALLETGLTQDNDVLDTWFSSALWPFSTLGWPDKTPELDYFYPGNVLVTAREIIFTWVIRMMFMGLEYMGDVPFDQVFINGIMLDGEGRKMSKSLGNGIDPVEIIDQFGADALRLMLVSGSAVDSDTRFFHERLEPARNFLNKLWNATRFVMMNLDDGTANARTAQHPQRSEEAELEFTSSVAAGFGAAPHFNEDAWILSRLNSVIESVTHKLETHEIGLAAQDITTFAWDEFCDWYVEIVKPRLYNKDNPASRQAAQHTLTHVLTTIVKLLHPIAPFVTEDLFQALRPYQPPTASETVMLSTWPTTNPAHHNPQAEKDIESIKEAVRAIRNIRTEKEVPPSKKITVEILPSTPDSIYHQATGYIPGLVNASAVSIIDTAPEGAVSVVVTGATIYLPMDSLVDKAAETARLQKEEKRLLSEIARIDGKLNNQGFVSKAPEALITAEKEKRENYSQMLQKVQAELNA